MRTNKRYGWKKDIPDFRDLKFIAPFRATALPSSVDLRDWFPWPVYDQGELGSCTANAIAGAIECDQRKQKLKEFTPSRLFIYYNERVLEGTVDSDSGAQIRDGIKTVASLGAPPEPEWPYDITRFAAKPSDQAYADGKLHPAVKYQAVAQNLNQLRAALAAGYPVVFGFTVYESFESDQVAQTGFMPMPGKNESVMGGHAVVMAGYDDKGKYFIVRNSWGSFWGQSGYFFMPYDYALNRDLASDFWVIEQVK